MSLPDELVGVWASAYTTLPDEVVSALADDAAREGRIARDAKLTLAAAIVERYHGTDAADRERAAFLDVFAHGTVPDELETVGIRHPASSALTLLEQVRPDLSRSALRRLISQDAVRIDGVPVTDPEQEVLVSSGSVVRTGRRSWARVALR